MYSPPFDPSAKTYSRGEEALATVGPPRAENADWREAAAQREAAIERRNEEAKQNRVYVAMGPLVGAILIANLITAIVVALIAALMRA